jgi:probable blue pigment (indigoidine) exporter
MEDEMRWRAVAAVAPVAWGSNYYVTHRYLPAGAPLWGAGLRALPAGLLLLAMCRRLPHGRWWWRSAVLGALNMGIFFGLVYVAAQRLPTSTASMVMANSPVAMMLVAWPLLRERPRPAAVVGAGIGIAGAGLMLGGAAAGVDAVGVGAAVSAMAVSSVGYVLAKRWAGDECAPGVIPTTSWQLVAGGAVLLPAAAIVHGAPPALDPAAVGGFSYVVVIATAGAFVAWFAGLRRLPAGTVGLIGLLNPVTGVLLGMVVAGDRLTTRQAAGIAMVVAGILAGQRARRGHPSARPKRTTSLRASGIAPTPRGLTGPSGG